MCETLFAPDRGHFIGSRDVRHSRTATTGRLTPRHSERNRTHGRVARTRSYCGEPRRSDLCLSGKDRNDPHSRRDGDAGSSAALIAPSWLSCRHGQPARSWGLRTFGQFAQLPPLGVVARLGEEGAHWQRQAQGSVTRQLRLLGQAVHLHKEVELEDSISTLEPLLFLLGKMLFELCIELTARSCSTNQLRVSLQLEGHANHRVRVQLPVPISDRETLLKLLHYELEQHPAPAPIQRVRLELEPVSHRRTQEHLFTPAYPFPEQLELTIARVRRIVGPENIGTPVVLATHRPDGFVMKSFASSAQSELEKPEKPIMLAFRRFRPPPPAQIKTERQPVHIASAIVKGTIASAKGPWHTSGDWWLQNPWQREEWDIGLQNGGLYKIYRDLATMSWFVDGNYD